MAVVVADSCELASSIGLADTEEEASDYFE